MGIRIVGQPGDLRTTGVIICICHNGRQSWTLLLPMPLLLLLLLPATTAAGKSSRSSLRLFYYYFIIIILGLDYQQNLGLSEKKSQSCSERPETSANGLR